MTKLFLSYDLEKLEKITHMTAWDQLWGSNETLKYGFKIEYVGSFCLAGMSYQWH